MAKESKKNIEKSKKIVKKQTKKEEKKEGLIKGIKKEIKLEKEQNKLKKQKIHLAKELKLLGIPTFKIKKITQLNINQINLL